MSTREDLPPMPPGTEPTTPRDDSLEQVRDLLFGSHLRGHERRVARMEERLAREVAALRADLKQRVDALREEVLGEVEALARTVAEEQVERARGHEGVTRRVEELASGLDARLEELRGEAERVHDDLARAAQREAALLREESEAARERERGELAGVLADLASRLVPRPPRA